MQEDLFILIITYQVMAQGVIEINTDADSFKYFQVQNCLRLFFVSQQNQIILSSVRLINT